ADGIAGPGSGHVIDSILGIASDRSESPLESWTRCLIVDAGLPQPSAQIPVLLRDGNTFHLDLGFREFKVGIECHGRRYHATSDDMTIDEQRRQQIEAVGWSVFTVYGSDVLVFTDDMLAELVWLLRYRGWRPSPDRLARVEKRIRYIAMSQRLNREDWNAAWGVC
ncbi:MAG: hypothetical protein ACRD0P_10370, partial [Stackebrandtia sp.]